MLRIRVALPLSAGRMVRSVFFVKVFSASLSALVKLFPGLEELLIILTVSCLVSPAISIGRDCTAFSTPNKMSSTVIVRGGTTQLRPFCSNEDTPSSSVWSIRLMTVSFDVFVFGCCVLWSSENFQSCLTLLSSHTLAAFLNLSWSIRDRSTWRVHLLNVGVFSAVFEMCYQVLAFYEVFFPVVRQKWCVDRFYCQLGNGYGNGTVRNEIWCRDLCSEGGK